MGKTFIIAEAGVNHNGSYDTAIKLIDVAIDARADAVKFQTWKTELLMTKNSRLAEYQKKSPLGSQSQFDLAIGLELSYPQFTRLKKYCVKKDIIFLSTPDEAKSAEFLHKLQDIFKIGSGEITNLPFLKYIGSFQKQIILSTGMATLAEIETALNILKVSGTPLDQITVLHCNTEYPTPMEDVNLKAMLTIRDKLRVNVGYSDHTLGIEVSVAAVALGATVIEKHFTLDQTLPGPDHAASLEPHELKEMVTAIRNIEKAMGNSEKKPSPSEIKNIPVARKSIVAKQSIKKGEHFSENNITVKRPGTGISPMEWDKVLGKIADIEYQIDDLIQL